jgi:protocatechuate 3,4-dioxygenase beta subunit
MHSIFLSLFLLLADPSSPAHLTGHVIDSDSTPIANATVMVYTAAPKKGPATQNPTDYPDCSKSAATDAQGAFSITGVDPALNYELLILADNTRPLLLRKVDPARGDIRALLQPLPKDTDADHLIHGHIVDSDGKPIVGARIEPFGEKNSSERYWSSSVRDVEDHTFTNAKGEFTLVCKKSGIQVDLKLTARNAAPILAALVSQGEQPTEFTLTPGANVTGRLVKDGAPVPGVTMRLCQVNRGIESWVGEFSAVTDNDGKFAFNHVKPSESYNLYATVKSLGDKGAVPLKPFNVTGDSTTTDAGDITLAPGVTVAGLLVDPDGKPVPNTKVSLSRSDAMDNVDANTDANGKFQFKSIPPGEIFELYVQSNGYHVTHNNQSFEPMNAIFLMGLIDQDINDLKVEVDKGPQEQRANNSNNWQSLRSTRLTGLPTDK